MAKNSSTNKILFILMAQKEHLDAQNATAKTSSLCKEPFLKKQEDPLKVPLKKVPHFWEI